MHPHSSPARRSRRIRRLVTLSPAARLAAALALLPSAARAQTIWAGVNSNLVENYWWSGPPSIGSGLTGIILGDNPYLAGNYGVHGLSVQAGVNGPGSLTITQGSTLTVYNGGLAPLSLEGASTLRFGAAGDTVAPAVQASTIYGNGNLSFESSAGTTLSASLGANMAIYQVRGTTTLTGSNGQNGEVNISGGTLVLGSANAGSSGAYYNLTGGTLNTGSTAFDLTRLNTLTSGAITGSGSYNYNSAADRTLGTLPLGGSASLVKSGAGNLTLSALNTYTGGTTVNGGTLTLATGGATGAVRGVLTINSGATVRATASNALGFDGNRVTALYVNGGTFSAAAGTADQGWAIGYVLNGGTLSSNDGVSSGTASSKFALGNFSNISVTGTTASTIAGRLDLRGDFNTHSDINVAAGATLNVTAAITTSVPTAGPTGFTKLGGGVLKLTGANTYTGTTFVNAGTLEFSNLGNLGTGNVTVNGGALRWASGNTADVSPRLNAIGTSGATFDTGANNVAFGSALSGSGAIAKLGSGTLTFNVANSHTGATNVATGTLVVNHSSALGTTAGGTTVVSGATLDLSAALGAEAITVSGTGVGGAGALLGNGTSSLSGALTLSGGATLGGTGSLTLSGPITGGALTKVGSGTLTLAQNATRTYTDTVVKGGTLVADYGSYLGTGSITVDGATFRYNGGSIGDGSRLIIGSGGATLVANGLNIQTYGDNFSALTGTNPFTKAGTGWMDLRTGTNYTGTITVSSGTLGVSAATVGNIVNNATVAFTNTNTYGGNLSGPGQVTLGFNTEVTFTGTNSYTGGTVLDGSFLTGNTGNLQGTFTGWGTVTFNQAADGTFAGTFSNASSAADLAKTGVGKLTLNGTQNHRHTAIKAGTLSFGSAASFGTGTISLQGGTLQWGPGNTTDISSRLITNGSAGRLDTGANDITFASGFGSASPWEKTGSGTLRIAAPSNLSYLTSSQGTVEFVPGGSLTRLPVTLEAYTGGFLFNGATVQASNLLVGTAAGGNGSVTVRDGSLTVLGDLLVGRDSATGPAGTLSQTGGTLNSAQTRVKNGGTATLSGGAWNATQLDLDGSGLVALSGGTFTSPNAIRLNSPSATFSFGAGAAGVGAFSAPGFTGNGTVAFNHTGDYTFAQNLGSDLSLSQRGAGMTTLSGANTYTGITSVSAGTLRFAGPTAFYNGDTSRWTTANLVVEAGATAAFKVGGAGEFTFGDFDSFRNLASPTGGFKPGAYLGLDIGGAGAPVTYSTVFTDSSAGALGFAKVGDGLLTFTAANTHTGGTIFAGGTLALGHAGALGSTGPLTFTGGILQYTAANQNDYSARFSSAAGQSFKIDLNGHDITLASPISSAGGTFEKIGAGTLTLTGNNTFDGLTTIHQGTLRIGAGGTTGSLGGGGLLNNGSVVFNRSDIVTLPGSVSGSGSLEHAGSGTLVLPGATTYTGNTTITGGGTLRFAGTLGTGTVNVGEGSLVWETGNTTDLSGRLAFNNGLGRLKPNGNAITFTSPLPSGTSLTFQGPGTVTLAASSNLSYLSTLWGGIIGGGAGSGVVIPAGTTLNLAGDVNHVDGVIVLDGGTLNNVNGRVGADANGAAIMVVNSGTWNNSGILYISARPNVGSTYGSLTINGGTVNSASSQVSVGAPPGSVTVNGGTWNTGSITLGNNYYSSFYPGEGIGTLTVTGGTVNVGNGSGPINIIRGGLAIGAGGTGGNVHGGTLTGSVGFNHTNTVTFSPAVSGSIEKGGSGTAILTGNSPGSANLYAGTLQLGDGGATGAIAGNIATSAGTALVVNRSGTAALPGVISGPATLTKQGSGTLTLSGANTYSGATTVSAGTLQFAQAAALPAANWNATKLVVNSGATAAFNAGGAGEFTAANIATLSALGTASGGFRSGSTLGLDTASASGGFTYGNVLANPNGGANALGLAKLGANRLTLTAANTYTGGTTIEAGTLAAGHANTFGTGAVRVNAGTLDLGGFAIANALDIRGGSVTGLASYAGTQTVSSAQSYSGTVGGTLVVASGGTVNTTGATFTGPATIQSGGTLQGTGTVASLTIQSGATLAPGNSPGLLTVNGNLTLDSGSFTTLEIAGLVRGSASGYDALDISGALTAGGTLSVSFTGGFVPNPAGATFDFFNFSSIGGSFAQVNLPAVSGYVWNTDNLLTDGTISISAIPEPAAWAALAGLATLGLTANRRRRRR